MALQDSINALFSGLPMAAPTVIALIGMGAGIVLLCFRPRQSKGLRAAAIALILCQLCLYYLFGRT